MKHLKHTLLCICALICACIDISAQGNSPVSWKVSYKALTDGVYEISAEGSFNGSGWHIYDLKQNGGGYNATSLTIEGKDIKTVSEVEVASKSSLYKDGASEVSVLKAPIVLKQRVSYHGEGEPACTILIEWQACNELTHECLSPSEYETTLKMEPREGNIASVKPAEKPAENGNGGKSLWSTILAAIAWGFMALLTPCVFPMVPMTVSFFIKQKKGKSLAIIFGLSIVALYTLPIAALILISLLTGGQSVTADIFNWLATHWLPNILFFIIFMVFAASFFGAFEITMPSKLVNDSDKKSDKGGLIGTFFVALTLVLVSFSCTGPIVGSVLIESTHGAIWEPIITMLAFSIAFALPFTILAFAPSLLKKLPKSGGWLNSVKVVLGFIEIALGFKFLSVADQTYHWGLLPREVYLAIWIVVFTLLGLYLLGKIRFKNDSPMQYVSVTRLVLAIVVFSFVVWMIPGMFGAPLKALSGYLPPITSQEFVLGGATGENVATYQLQEESKPERKYADFLEVPYGIDAYFDYEEARQAAIAQGKPLLVDFTGHGCVNCREMESRVWSDSKVLSILKNDYIVCSLFTDDKKKLDESDWVVSDSGKTLKTLGKINSNFALTRFGVNAQPTYIILDAESEAILGGPRGYDLDINDYIKFLNIGLEK